jgi:multicomponent K+:H+ antiporter subunit D
MGKALLLQAAGALPHAGWWVGGVLVSSLMILVALARAGSRLFWEPGEARGMRLPPAAPGQKLALSGLLLAVLACAVFARPLGRYAEQAAGQLLDRAAYIRRCWGASRWRRSSMCARKCASAGIRSEALAARSAACR